VDTSRKLAIVLKWVGGSDYLRTSFFYFSFSFGEQILSQFCFCFVWNAGFDDFSPPRDSLRSGNHFFLCFFFFLLLLLLLTNIFLLFLFSFINTFTLVTDTRMIKSNLAKQS
jgi:hypothetical protein